MYRCDEDKPCVGFCESERYKHECGMKNREGVDSVATTIVDLKIDKWFEDRGIVANGKPMGQAIKTLEETTELLDALNRDDKAEVMDAIGDIYVTLRGVCLTYGVSFERCRQLAYDEIKHRTGTLGADGVFRKDEHQGQTTMEFNNE